MATAMWACVTHTVVHRHRAAMGERGAAHQPRGKPRQLVRGTWLVTPASASRETRQLVAAKLTWRTTSLGGDPGNWGCAGLSCPQLGAGPFGPQYLPRSQPQPCSALANMWEQHPLGDPEDVPQHDTGGNRGPEQNRVAQRHKRQA